MGWENGSPSPLASEQCAGGSGGASTGKTGWLFSYYLVLPSSSHSFPRFSRAEEGVDDGRRLEETARANETCALCFYWGPAWGRPKEFGSIDKLCIYLRQVLT